MSFSVVVFGLLWIYFNNPILAFLNCSLRKDGSDYGGKLNVANNGAECLPWILANKKYSLNELKLTGYHKNYCRNPDSSSSPWCYVNINMTRFCDVPFCSMHPSARMCIPYVKQHFYECPIMFEQHKKAASDAVLFCCLRKQYNPSILPISNNCLLVILELHKISKNYSACPLGYKIERAESVQLKTNHIVYRCCGSRDLTQEEFISDNLLKRHVATNYSIFGAVTDSRGNCNFRVFKYFSMKVEQYVDHGTFGKNMSSLFRAICLYYSVLNRSGSTTELALYSDDQCPLMTIKIHQDESLIRPLFLCKLMSQDKLPGVTFGGGICLRLINGECREKFYKYSLRIRKQMSSLVEFCCTAHNEHFIWHHYIPSNHSITFVTMIKSCPYMITNHSIQMIQSKTILSVQLKQRSITDFALYLCTYKTQSSVPLVKPGQRRIAVEPIKYNSTNEVCVFRVKLDNDTNQSYIIPVLNNKCPSIWPTYQGNLMNWLKDLLAANIERRINFCQIPTVMETQCQFFNYTDIKYVHMCCSTKSILKIIKQESKSRLRIVLPSIQYKCPSLSMFRNERLNQYSNESLGDIRSFCSYVKMKRTKYYHWPKGYYYSIATDNRCPWGFKLVYRFKYNLCKPKYKYGIDKFPNGSYCLLLPFNDNCDAGFHTVISKVPLGVRNYVICCKRDNYSIPFVSNYKINKIFTYLSTEKCPNIFQYDVEQNNFLEYETVHRCQYILTNKFKLVPIKTQLIIFLSISVFLLLLVFCIYCCHRVARRYFRLRQVKYNEVELSTVYDEIQTNPNSSRSHPLYTTYSKVRNTDEVESVTYSTLS